MTSTLQLPKPYLEMVDLTRTQYRKGRRDDPLPAVVAHTSQGGRRATAKGTFAFISTRSDPGSYHLIGDERAIWYLVDLDNEAFGDRTGSNKWAVHVSLAMDADEWVEPGFVRSTRGLNLMDTFGQMIAIAGHHFADKGLIGHPEEMVRPRWPGRRDLLLGATSHATRDPGRRSDPGAAFPWDRAREAARTYLLNPDAIDKIHYPEGDPAMPTQPTDPERVVQLQKWLQANGHASSDDPSYVDGKLGPVTSADLFAVLNTRPGMSDSFETWVQAQRDIAAAEATIEKATAVIDSMVEAATRGIGR